MIENIKETLFDLFNYYNRFVGVGHTTSLKQGTDNIKTLVLIKDKTFPKNYFGISREVTLSNTRTGLRGHKLPLVIDNSALTEILKAAFDRINDLEYKISVFTEKKIK